MFGELLYLLYRVYTKSNNKIVNLCIILMSIFLSIITLDNFVLTNIIKYLVLSSFIIIVFVDLKEMIIPDTLIIFEILLIIINYVIFNQSIFEQYKFNSNEIIFALVSVTILLVIVITVHLIWKKELMGYGDIKLLFVMGLMIGFTKLILIIFVSSFVALIIEAPQIRKKKNGFPFGPYLVLAFILVYLFGNNILDYLFTIN